MSQTYYAVCDCNGPISRRLMAKTLEAAITELDGADLQSWIDEPATDVEDEQEIDGYGMGESAFAAALTAAGLEMVHDAASVDNPLAGTVAHLAGGWRIWCVTDEDVTEEEYDRLAQALARRLITDDRGRAPEVPVRREGALAIHAWWESAAEAGDQDTLDAIRACGDGDHDARARLARAWDALIDELVPEAR